MATQIDLFDLIFREILKISPNVLYNYTLIQDQILYLILIPTVIGGFTRGFIKFTPDGVSYEPIVNPMKLALAGIALAAWAIYRITRCFEEED